MANIKNYGGLPLNSEGPRTILHTKPSSGAVKAERKTRQSLPTLQIYVRRLHLWLGASVGFMLVLLGLTGSALVFYVEIDHFLNLQPTATHNSSSPGFDSPIWDRTLATGLAYRPEIGGKWSFEVSNTGGPIAARYYPPAPDHDHHAEREMLWFSPDGAEIIRAEAWGSYLMSWIYELHMHLLTGENGRQIIGWSGVISLALLLSGLWAWWPRGSWRKALRFKAQAASIRRSRDIHKLTGLVSLVFLFILCATGALLALPDIKAQLLPSVIEADPRSSAQSGTPISLSQALAFAHQAHPTAILAFIDVPVGGDEAIRLRLQLPGDPHRRFPSSYVFIDQYNGTLLGFRDANIAGSSAFISRYIRALHDGTAAGLTGRIIAFITGFLPLILLVTGLLHWRQRTRAQKPSFPTGYSA